MHQDYLRDQDPAISASVEPEIRAQIGAPARVAFRTEPRKCPSYRQTPPEPRKWEVMNKYQLRTRESSSVLAGAGGLAIDRTTRWPRTGDLLGLTP